MTEEEKLALYVKYCIGQIPGYVRSGFPCAIANMGIKPRRNWNDTGYIRGDGSVMFDVYTNSIRHMIGRIWLGTGKVYLINMNDGRASWRDIPGNIMKYDRYLEHGGIRPGLLKVPFDMVTEKFK